MTSLRISKVTQGFVTPQLIKYARKAYCYAEKMSARKRKGGKEKDSDVSSTKLAKSAESSNNEFEKKSKYFLTNTKTKLGMCSSTGGTDTKAGHTVSLIGGDGDKGPSSVRKDYKFYDKPCDKLAKDLLGKKLVRKLDTGEILSGMIVETEAYLGLVDKAAHSFKGKTDRNTAMFMDPGTSYVYNIYGMYCCMNISSEGDGCAVLLRALDPVDGISIMEKERSKGKKDQTKKMKQKDFCNGPSKLCQSLHITKNNINMLDMTSSNKIWLEDYQQIPEEKIVISKRININYAEDWVDKLLRFYVMGNNSVSVRDKKVEESMKN